MKILLVIFIFSLNVLLAKVYDCTAIFKERQNDITNSINELNRKQKDYELYKASQDAYLSKKEANINKKEQKLKTYVAQQQAKYIKNLQAKKDSNDKKEKELIAKEKDIQALIKQNQDLLAQLSQGFKSKVTTVYSKMQPAKIATILKSMPTKDALKILLSLPNKIVSKVMGQLDDVTASRLTLKMMGSKSKPIDKTQVIQQAVQNSSVITPTAQLNTPSKQNNTTVPVSKVVSTTPLQTNSTKGQVINTTSPTQLNTPKMQNNTTVPVSKVVSTTPLQTNSTKGQVINATSPVQSNTPSKQNNITAPVSKVVSTTPLQTNTTKNQATTTMPLVEVTKGNGQSNTTIMKPIPKIGNSGGQSDSNNSNISTPKVDVPKVITPITPIKK